MPTPLSVLVVDDEPQVAAAIAYMIRRDLVRVVTSGEAAVEACRTDRFDLILCDLLMPRMSGQRVYEALRELGTGAHERFVFMTGWTADAADLAHGGRAVLTKPVHLDALNQLLDRLRTAKS